MYNMNYHTSLATASPSLGGRSSRLGKDAPSWRLTPSPSLFASTERPTTPKRRSISPSWTTSSKRSIFATIQTEDVVDSLLTLNQTYHKWSVKLQTRKRGVPLQGKLTAMTSSLLELNRSYLDVSPQSQGVPLLGSTESRLRRLNTRYTQQQQLLATTQPGVLLSGASATNHRLRQINATYTALAKELDATPSVALQGSIQDKLATRLLQLNRDYIATVEGRPPSVSLQGAPEIVLHLAKLNRQYAAQHQAARARPGVPLLALQE